MQGQQHTPDWIGAKHCFMRPWINIGNSSIKRLSLALWTRFINYIERHSD